MKLSEADFRPRHRAGIVPPPRRKIPLLRLLLLLIAGALVYKHFDSFWPRLRSWMRPSLSRQFQKSGPPAANGKPVWKFSGDSTRAFLNRGRTKEDVYCGALETFKAGLCGQVHAIMEKGRWLGELNAPVLSKVEMRIPRPGSDSLEIPVLAAVEGRDRTGSFRYQRADGDPLEPWCDPTKGCLTSQPPGLPMTRGKASDTAADEPVSRWISPVSGVFAVLPGLVASVDSLGPENHRVTLYHGRELYTTYEGLRHIAGGLIPGARVDPGKSIGEAEPVNSPVSTDSSRYTMVFRVEQAGSPLDPGDFLARAERKPNGP